VLSAWSSGSIVTIGARPRGDLSAIITPLATLSLLSPPTLVVNIIMAPTVLHTLVVRNAKAFK
jgi:hypothetical protein